MRFLIFDDHRLGMLEGEMVRDVTPLVGRRAEQEGLLHHLIADGVPSWTPEQLAAREGRPLAEVVVRAPLPRPPKVVGAPVNYVDHKAEMSEVRTIADYGVFLKATSSIIGPDEQVMLPYTDVRTDQEGELAVVIGRTARHVSAREALHHVFGYTCALDMTVRSGEDRSTRKSFDTFTPIGPVVVTADELGDAGALQLETRVNGEVRQQTSTSALIYGVAELIAYASSVMTLWPGDVILTGTPAGVGPVEDGDVVEVEISGIGTLRVEVSGATATPYAGRPGGAVLESANQREEVSS